ncbi:MAG: anthranilate phosphoribosyltransferase [Desulfarculaceae bacterium]|nr:anthranilate phosphoribosyltransferase [Desulfarculaceae bacterium]MCF8071662.1 anthranilate phosphoribosyltransferase [Desulfarculaceae bacterium]MCF8102491.1 anthranilate phosphoribosyltransferase [Desulfarculaceae bacterium]MCF8114941.1 anthranilate phosphoribosyltransferase [Desulfarculaceae bacterium]
MIQQAIALAVSGQDLSEEQMIAAMDQIMEGQATQAQIGAFLVALRMKGECLSEISGAARVMRAKATPVACRAQADGEVLVDTVGTGGDGAGTFNVSTTTAFVVAGAGLKVAKHGNRAISSSCGAADLLEALGVPLDLSPEQIGACIDEVGVGFLFAPALHGAMRHAIGPRREVGLRTVFNLLGPLTNPAGANVLVVGVYDPALVEPLAHVLGRLGVDSAYVVHGEGMDEVTVTGSTAMARLQGGQVETLEITPEQFGLRRAAPEEVAGGTVDQCRAHTLAVLKGEPGARRDMVLLNAAAALAAAGKAGDLARGVALASEIIDSGAALAKLEQLVSFSQGLKRQVVNA